MGRIPYTPGVFVRVAKKGLGGYGTWKNLRRMGGENDMGVGVSAEKESRDRPGAWRAVHRLTGAGRSLALSDRIGTFGRMRSPRGTGQTGRVGTGLRKKTDRAASLWRDIHKTD
jgi:hypothetical protein